MDNATITISDVGVEPSNLAAGLSTSKIKLTRRTDPAVNGEQMLFSMPVGRYKQRWLFRVHSAAGTVTCSGGVTKTFFGHNLYVFTNEGEQLEAITRILIDSLRALPGLTFAAAPPVSVDRAELTRHHELPPEVAKNDALAKLDRMQMVLLPSRYSNEGRTLDDPGTIRIGKTKSSRVCRIYDPAIKFAKRPRHIPQDSWAALCRSREHELRVEVMLNKRELKAAGLDTIAGWFDYGKVLALIETRYRRFGLSVAFCADSKGLSQEKLRKEHRSWVEYAWFFFSGGENGSAPNPRSGATARYKRYMLSHGYCVDIPLSRHVHLAHGLHEYLQPSKPAGIAAVLKGDKALFLKWWRPN